MTVVAASGTGRHRDGGAVGLEFGGIIPLALFIIFLAYQAYVAFTTVSRVENIARTGAREASMRYEPGLCHTYGARTRPRWLNDYEVEGGATKSGGTDAVYCRVEAKLPIIFKGVPLDYTVTRTVTMPLG
ncbi:TadE/TadG family type IV pilus assembly protein [Spirillospora sp. CA-294931]|uniref:TadE/TadG family type IV pilus assembly protein n=1 Tax=Spirillospora sp. CA-294931 TaxID=3240042 RepID=UPI003D8E5C01